jgi:DNA mismatch repair protein MutL
MAKIRALDPITVTKIAAGEVIDRPASIVKELVENSLDAHATRIQVDIEDGGKRLIRITDNGDGISKEDLPIAPQRHTTSKITALEDLYLTDTFGFRGEALASVCHVAKLDITSRQDGTDAYHISAFQDTISEPEVATLPKGTRIEVKDLFFDIPVRRQFLKTAGTERSHITDIMIQFAVSNPTLDFILISDGEEVINSTGIENQEQLLIHLFGRSLKGHLVPVEHTIGPVTFKGHISDPTLTFSNRSKQIVSVNRRLVKSGIVQKALMESFKDLIPARRFPLVALDISVSKQNVDVNIHPQKLDIKFVNPGFLYDALPKAVSFSLQTNDTPLPSASQENPFAHHYTDKPSTPSSTSDKAFSGNYNQHFAPFNAETEQQTPSFDSLSNLFSPEEGNKPVFEYFQLFNTYIAVKTPEGLYVLDQHAVHERILYEKIKDTFGQNTERQALLLSEIVDLSPDLFIIFQEHTDYFESLNFVIEEFGQNKIVVRELPIAFAESNTKDLVIDILEQLKNYPGSSRDLTLDQKETLQMKACKAAIKAGKTMYPEEVQRLVEDLVKSPSNYTCPHGRPLCLFFDKNKLESLFLRS